MGHIIIVMLHSKIWQITHECDIIFLYLVYMLPYYDEDDEDDEDEDD
jgi:hypothetical protein